MDEFDVLNNPEKELEEAKEKINELNSIITKMKAVIEDNDLEDELDDVSFVSDSEKICVKGISVILELVDKKIHTDSDIKNFDILYKNLRLIHGKEPVKGKSSKPLKEADVSKLLGIVKG